jgi:hypothetical protein
MNKNARWNSEILIAVYTKSHHWNVPCYFKDYFYKNPAAMLSYIFVFIKRFSSDVLYSTFFPPGNTYPNYLTLQRRRLNWKFYFILSGAVVAMCTTALTIKVVRYRCQCSYVIGVFVGISTAGVTKLHWLIGFVVQKQTDNFILLVWRQIVWKFREDRQ